MTEPFGYSLSVLEASINARAHDPGYEQILLDRQLQLAHIERLEHIALALENLSDVGDVVASKLTFGTVPGEGSYADGKPGGYNAMAERPAPPFDEVVQDPGMTGPATVFGPATREDLATRANAAMPFCDAPGCKEPVAHQGIVDGVGRRVCVLHMGMLNANPDTPLGGPQTPPEPTRPFVACDVEGCAKRASHSLDMGKKAKSYCEEHIGEGVKHAEEN